MSSDTSDATATMQSTVPAEATTRTIGSAPTPPGPPPPVAAIATADTVVTGTRSG